MVTDEQLETFREWPTRGHGRTPTQYEAEWEELYEVYMRGHRSRYRPPTKAAWQARNAEAQALRDENRRLHRMVSFFASSIKSGEQ